MTFRSFLYPIIIITPRPFYSIIRNNNHKNEHEQIKIGQQTYCVDISTNSEVILFSIFIFFFCPHILSSHEQFREKRNKIKIAIIILLLVVIIIISSLLHPIEYIHNSNISVALTSLLLLCHQMCDSYSYSRLFVFCFVSYIYRLISCTNT